MIQYEIKQIPPWPLKRLAASKGKKKVAEPENSTIVHGKRNDTLTSLAGSMRARGMGERSMVAALAIENEDRCKPPLDIEEVQQIAQSVARYDPNQIMIPANGQVVLPEPISAKDLLTRKFPPQEWLIQYLIAKGHSCNLGGRAKSGKSYLVLEFQKAIDTGKSVLGRDTLPARTIYIALEDGERRVYNRLKLIDWKPSFEAMLLFDLARFDGEHGGPGPGLEQIAQLADKFDFIVIDTLIRTLGPTVSENDNVAMARIMNTITAVAHSKDTAILVVHHTGKQVSEDPFHTLRGASAIRGGYDVGLILERKANEREAVLHVESRDYDYYAATLRQAEGGVGWEVIGGEFEIERIRAWRKTLQAIFELDPDGKGITAKTLADHRRVSLQAIYTQLSKLEDDGYIRRSEIPEDTDGRPADLYFIVEYYR